MRHNKLMIYLSLKKHCGVTEKVWALEKFDKSGFTVGSATH